MNPETTDVNAATDSLATASAVPLPAGVPEWVQLFPYGTFTGRDGRGPYTIRDQAHATQIIAATMAYQAGADAPVDYDHQTQLAASNGQPAPAAGWMTEFEARPDGVYGRSSWTARAAQHLDAKEYRYISPTFMHARNGDVLRIVGAGLTNLPNLVIPAIAHQQRTDDMSLEDLLKQLRAAVGLGDDASAEAVVTHCQQLAGGASAVAKLLGLPEATKPDQLATAAQSTLTALATILKAEGAATLPALATAAQKLSSATGAPDPAKYVPMDVHLAVASQLTELQGQTSASETEREVDQAVQSGKVTPAMKEWALAFASQDLPGFRKYVEKAPVLVAAAQKGQASTGKQPPASDGSKLSDEELAVAKQMGLSAEEFLKTKKGTK